MVYIIILIAIILIAVPVVRKALWSRRDYAELREMVHKERSKFIFLIDKKFRVKETNFYELNENIKDDQPYVLGNVMHCQNGCESGLCGTGLGCDECPIRLIVNNSFKLKRDFDNLTATMHLYDANHVVREVDVIADGKLVYIGSEPHIIVNVRKLIQ